VSEEGGACAMAQWRNGQSKSAASPVYYHTYQHTIKSTGYVATDCSSTLSSSMLCKDNSSAVADISRKVGRAAVPLLVGAGSPSTTMWSGSRPTSITKWHLDPSSRLATR